MAGNLQAQQGGGGYAGPARPQPPPGGRPGQGARAPEVHRNPSFALAAPSGMPMPVVPPASPPAKRPPAASKASRAADQVSTGASPGGRGAAPPPVPCAVPGADATGPPVRPNPRQGEGLSLRDKYAAPPPPTGGPLALRVSSLDDLDSDEDSEDDETMALKIRQSAYSLPTTTAPPGPTAAFERRTKNVERELDLDKIANLSLEEVESDEEDEGAGGIMPLSSSGSSSLESSGHMSDPRGTEKENAPPLALTKVLADTGTNFLLNPAPKDQFIQCKIIRHKGLMGRHPSYSLRLQDGNRFLIAARKRKKTKTSQFILSVDPSETKRTSDGAFAKLKANVLGTEYILYQVGGRDEKGREDKAGRRELLMTHFKQTATSVSGGPRLMISSLTDPPHCSPSSEHGLVERYQHYKAHGDVGGTGAPVLMFRNKKPSWDEVIKAYTLDFKGRVRKASVKNFQLQACAAQSKDGHGPILLQFGKNGANEFALDFKYPFSIAQAFASALSSIDGKLCFSV